MMLDILQKKFSKSDSDIIDIVLYGSVARGKEKPADIDLLVIFRSKTLKERLHIIQEMKHSLDVSFPVDMKSILLEELLDPSFFGRVGALVDGISIFSGKKFAHRLGFEGKSIVVYSLKNKSHTEKVQFNYLLRGRYGQGILERVGATHLAPGVVLVPSENSEEFYSVLKLHNISFESYQMLMGPHTQFSTNH